MKKSLSILSVIFLVALGIFYMYKKQYQMAVFVTPESENDLEWPNKKKWFDVGVWLRNSQCIKIDDFHLLNIKYIPIEKIDYPITRAIQRSIKYSINSLPRLSQLAQMNDVNFYNLMKDNLSYEYLRTEFNSKELTPVNDYFIFFFYYKGRSYEVVLLREPFRDGVSFPYAGLIYTKGHWHSASSAGYSYKDYLAGEPIK